MQNINLHTALPEEPTTLGCEDEILRSLRRIMRAVDLYSHKLMTSCGLTGPQLLCLRQLEQRGPMRTGALAHAMSLSPATVSGILDRLEARALVTRERQINDKRTVVVRLARAGANMIAEAPPPLQDKFVLRLGALSFQEKAEIRDTLQKVVVMMAAEDIDASPLLSSGEVVPRAPAKAGVARRNET